MTPEERARLEYLTAKPTITTDEFNEMERLSSGDPTPYLSLEEAVMMGVRAQRIARGEPPEEDWMSERDV